ncbi:hypothetical protein [Streptomyces sp. NPDC006551]|uniref:hypothetical protein n=1 Tax=Streptomyces sp. NPDC006551 TaxID=3157178 RepID=UPI0033AC5205
MDIPVAVRWVLLALAVLQLLSLISILRRMRQPDAGLRAEARLDLLDAAGSVALLTGIVLGNTMVVLCGLTVMGSVIAVKGIRSLRARRQADPRSRHVEPARPDKS